MEEELIFSKKNSLSQHLYRGAGFFMFFLVLVFLLGVNFPAFRP